jgi:hypothetical protein
MRRLRLRLVGRIRLDGLMSRVREGTSQAMTVGFTPPDQVSTPTQAVLPAAPLPAALRADLIELIARMVVKDLRENPRVAPQPSGQERDTTVDRAKGRER